MKRHTILGSSLALIAHAAAEQSNAAGGTEAPAEAPAEGAKKSIVPAKYAGKYKGAGDSVSEFITAQGTGKDGFEFTAFFSLARKNGIAEDKVAHYEKQVGDKLAGAAGRARMTLGNMLRSIARNKGELVGLNDEVTTFSDLKKPAVSGAAAKAQESAATEDSASVTEETTASEDATTE